MPDGGFLIAIAQAGADVQYILTGVRSEQVLSSDEKLLLERYRAAAKAGKDAILGAALGQKTFDQKYAGGVQQVIESMGYATIYSAANTPTPKNKK